MTEFVAVNERIILVTGDLQSDKSRRNRILIGIIAACVVVTTIIIVVVMLDAVGNFQDNDWTNTSFQDSHEHVDGNTENIQKQSSYFSDVVSKQSTTWTNRTEKKQTMTVGKVSGTTLVTKIPEPRFHHYNLAQDNIDIQTMINSAKRGNFDIVWTILNKKSYLINVIPENESFALLHYAANFSDFKAVRRLVAYNACDVRVRSAPRGNKTTNAGKIPEQIASNEHVKTFLHDFTEEKMEERFKIPPTFFATQRKGEEYNTYGLPLLLISLSAYKKTFYGRKQLDPHHHFQNILKFVFENSDTDLINVETTIINSLYSFDAGAAQYLKSTNKTEFYKSMIRLYTGGSIYGQLNRIMKEQAFYDYKNYRPRSRALHLGPYALMLDSILSFWEEVRPFKNKTYRGVSVNVTSHYHVGMTFVYVDFVSSTDDKSVAISFAGLYGSVFVINNVQKTPWQPRDIAIYSMFPTEREYLYPPGAEFKVTKLDKKFIYLDLIEPHYVSKS